MASIFWAERGEEFSPRALMRLRRVTASKDSYLSGSGVNIERMRE